jgi:hypothetical protein
MDNLISAVIFEFENQLKCGPAISGCLFHLGPPVRGHWACRVPHADRIAGVARL